MFDVINPSLLWGLPLVGVPVLIHLINLLRHRRVQWAAMEFLLQSVKKNTNWIRFKELLLLALRMLAVASVVMMASRPRLRSEFGRWIGEERTHHVLLLDDSYSMSEAPAGGVSCFDRAKAAIERIAAHADGESTSQAFTLVRFSQCGRIGRSNRFDLAEVQVDSEFAQRLQETLRPLAPSATAATPAAALTAVETLLEAADDGEREVYLLSDFRAKEWSQPGDLTLALERISRGNARLHLIECADAPRGNLGIVQLASASGVRAAGVPFKVDISVRNHGTNREANVEVELLLDGNPAPAVRFDSVGAGETETLERQIAFDKPGRHKLTARLVAERAGVAADNARYAALDLPESVPVLIIEGDPTTVDARLLTRALAPRGVIKTGLSPTIRPPQFLNANPLDGYTAIFLLNVPRLDQPGVAALETYAKGGGGVCFFMGDACQIEHYNQELHRDGKGLFPARLRGRISLFPDEAQEGADVVAGDHPAFAALRPESNKYLSELILDRYMGLDPTWKPGPDSSVRTVASVRNGAPLVLDSAFPQGRVMAVLTTAGPAWNNWIRGPSFVLFAHTAYAHLAARANSHPARLAGSPIVELLSEAAYRRQARFLAPEPDAKGAMREPVTFDLERNASGLLEAAFHDTDVAGIYELEIVTTENQPETRQFAINVDPLEGDLQKPERDAFERSLAGVPHELQTAEAFQAATAESRGSQLSAWILYVLGAILLGEQFLAYAASYHPARGPSA